MRIKYIILELFICILISVWAFTFVSKRYDFDTFSRQIKGAYLLSAGGSALPYILQAVHLGIVILLLNKNWRGWGLMTSLTLLILYTLYLIYILKLAPSIPCSCIALIRGMNWNEQLYFNYAALAINIIGLIALPQKQAPHSIQANY